jgi:hypothetical protein
MKSITKLSLSDLINGLRYLEETANRIESYIISIEKTEPDETRLMVKKLRSVRIKAINYRKLISEILLDSDEQKVTQKIDKKSNEKKQTDLEIIDEYIEKAFEVKRIPAGKDFDSLIVPNSTLYRKLHEDKFLLRLIAELKGRLESNYRYKDKSKKLLKDLLDYAQQNYTKLAKKIANEEESESKDIYTDNIEQYYSTWDKEDESLSNESDDY